MTRFRFVSLLFAGLALSGSPLAQPASTTARRTGDAWVDARLADMDGYAATYRESFVDEMTRYHRAPRDLVLELLARPGWSAGDVYYACDLAQQAGQPCRAVADQHAKNPGAWETVARGLGVVAGSPALHALKHDIVASYDRWARPVRVDAELAPDFPERPHESKPPKAPAVPRN